MTRFKTLSLAFIAVTTIAAAGCQRNETAPATPPAMSTPDPAPMASPTTPSAMPPASGASQ